MACRHLRFDLAGFASDEWVPMALREATCMLRRSNPEKWNEVLRCRGVEVDPDDIHCLHNLEASWHVCPLYRGRHVDAAPTQADATQAHSERPDDERPDGDDERPDSDDERPDGDDVPRNEHGYPLRL